MADSMTDLNNNEPEVFEKTNGCSKPQEAETFFETLANLKDEDLIRGTTPVNLKEKCLSLCQTYIGGTWAQASTADIEVNRITGGLTNQLYKVTLKNAVFQTENSIYRADEPKAVAIKLYEPKHMANYHQDDSERLNDIIVLTILSEAGIGPKVYGIFNEGFIQAFHEHDIFSPKYQQNPKVLRELAHLLARVHHLNVPIRKSGEPWYITEIQNFIDFAYENCNVANLVEELNLSTMKKHDLRQEFAQFKMFYKSIISKPVFCHSDFRCMNILVTKPEQKILLVDLEYSAYTCRAYDIATFIMEWGNERFNFKKMGIPEDSVLEHFAQLYIDGCEQLSPGYSKAAENSVAEIVRETKLFILAQYMFFTSFMIKQKESFITAMPFDQKSNMKNVEDIYSKYYEIKQQLIDDGVIEC